MSQTSEKMKKLVLANPKYVFSLIYGLRPLGDLNKPVIIDTKR